MKLLPENELIWSPVVANNAMNRKRKSSGINSYEQELKFKPEAYLNTCLEQKDNVKWLDLCCGEGNALLQYAGVVTRDGRQDSVSLLGVDLVDQFQPVPSDIHCLRFETASLVNWNNDDRYDLITCIHGLHYVGDKLKALSMILQLIGDHGLFSANLDLKNIRIEGEENSNYLRKLFAENNIDYNARRKLVTCKGPRDIRFNLNYQGADDKTGPNYTGQPVVDSYYNKLLSLS